MPSVLPFAPRPRARLSGIFAGLIVVLPAAPVRPAAPPAAIPVQYWSLPTGSRIGYVRIAASRPNGAPPVVFIHGGPGACEVYAYAFAHSWYERLARQGFDVYLYDQIGSGYSARLPDPRRYTFARHLADLEAIRRSIGSERLILIGESHGATLAAAYLAAHPGRVERIVFVSPGALEPAARKAQIFPHATPRVAPEFLSWVEETRDADTRRRCRRLDELVRRNVRAAHAFAGDAEMDALMDAWVRERILRTCVHDPARLEEHPFAIPHMGWWSSLMTTWDEVNHDRRVRARLAAVDTPALILRGDADYLPADIAGDYLAALRRAKLVRVEAAGHFIWMDRPEVYCGRIEAFLSATPGPGRP